MKGVGSLKNQTKIIRILTVVLLTVCVSVFSSLPVMADTTNNYSSLQHYDANGVNVGDYHHGIRIGHGNVPITRPRDDGRYPNNDGIYLPTENALVTQSGTVLMGNNGNGQWVMLTSSFSRDLKVAGQRIGMVDSNGYLVVRDGVYGQWLTESTSNFDEYRITPVILVMRVGSTLYSKAYLNDSWSLLATNVASIVSVEDNRVSYIPLTPVVPVVVYPSYCN